ncbi:MAG TPA: DUF3558 family protein [Acidimicrobiia bacterium]
MHLRNRTVARPFATTLALATLITSGAACSSSGKSSARTTGSTAAQAGQTGTAGSTTTGAPSSGNGPNPCTLVTAAEVQAILGANASPTGPTEENRGSVCKWHPGNGSSMLVQVFHGKEFYDPSIQAPKATKLTGVGDTAYLDAFGTTRAGVGFLKGDVAVFIDGFQITSSQAVVAAARDAASKV